MPCLGIGQALFMPKCVVITMCESYFLVPRLRCSSLRFFCSALWLNLSGMRQPGGVPTGRRLGCHDYAEHAFTVPHSQKASSFTLRRVDQCAAVRHLGVAVTLHMGNRNDPRPMQGGGGGAATATSILATLRAVRCSTGDLSVSDYLNCVPPLILPGDGSATLLIAKS